MWSREDEARVGAIRVGIGGWNYAPWRGTFYPPGLPQKRELEFAARAVTAIEINATYYGRQKPASFAAWAAAVPDDFRFSLKASRYSTSRRVLADSAESVGIFLDQGFTELGDRLGPIVWQFPTSKAFEREDFARFLVFLPDAKDGRSVRHALDVRHESFRDERFFALARERNMAVVLTDSDGFPRIEADTADFTYARLMRAREDVATGYDADGLDTWTRYATASAAAGRDAYLFFIAGEKLRDPAAARALIQRLS